MSEWYVDNVHIGSAALLAPAPRILSDLTLVPALGFKGLTIPPIQSEVCSGAASGSMHRDFFTSDFLDYISMSPVPNNLD